MTGNVTEWCWDWYAPFSETTEFKSTGPEAGQHKVEKGGMFWSDGVHCRVYYRHFVPPDEKYRRLGFRLCRSKN
jgi:formylglycine-generating enzyme required for sulfatase activity